MKSWGERFNYHRFLIFFILLISLTGCFHNEAPVSDAGESQNVLVGNKVLLDGSNSYDIDGNIVEFKWKFIQIPKGSNAFLSEADVIDPTFIVDLAGVYVIGLAVFDGELYSNEDIVIITATNDEANTSHSYLTPPSEFSSEYIAMVDSAIIIGSIDYKNLQDQNDPSRKVKILETTQNFTAQLLNNWQVVSWSADSNFSLTLNDDSEMEFITDTVGDYLLLLTHVRDDVVIGFATARVRVQESQVFAGDNRQVFVGNPVMLRANIVDEIDQNETLLLWELTLKPDDSNAQVESGEQYPFLMPDVAGKYEVTLSVDTTRGLYFDKILIEAVIEEVIFDHSATTSPCGQCHIKPDEPSKPDTDPLPEPLFPIGLEMKIDGLDITYPLGDVIKLSATLANNSDVDVEYYKMTSSSVGVVVEIQTASGSRFTLHHPADPDFDLQVVTKAVLMPGESITRKVEWDQSIPGKKMAVPGNYKVNAYAFITQLNEETSGEFSATGFVTIDSPAEIITEVNAILAGLKDAMVNQWYVKSQKSMLCSTESEGLVLVNDYTATPIQTLVAVPESEINCSAKLLVSANQWKVSYRGTSPTDNQHFEVIIDAITGEIIPKVILYEMK